MFVVAVSPEPGSERLRGVRPAQRSKLGSGYVGRHGLVSKLRVLACDRLVDSPSFAKLLQQQRRSRGLTQEELADRARLSVRAISDLERGLNKVPRSSTVRLLIEALGLAGAEGTQLKSAAQPLSQGVDPAQQPAPAVALPQELTSFVGRTRELADLEKLLAKSRLLTLTGPGGSGKTRLALRLATTATQRLEDGVVFVALASVFESGLVLPTLAQTVGLPEIGPRAPLAALREYFQTRQLLLILDNFEQLLPAGPALLELLANCPRLTILVTSRFPLRLSGEQEYEVPPLAVPDSRWLIATETDPVAALLCFEAARLFVERARAVNPNFAVSATEAGALADICRDLDGLPLAIELAAARVRLLALPAMAARLSGGAPWHRSASPLQLLSGGARDLPQRQQTLHAAIAWSYDLLTESEQEVFRHLAVFFGGASLEAIQACAGASGGDDRQWPVAPEDVLTDVEALIAKSLLVRRSGPDGGTRVDMFETIREFGLEQLTEAAELEAARRWHAGYYLAVAEQAELQLRGADQRAWLDRLEAEHDNLRAALEWGLTTEGGGVTALRLSAALAWFWLDRGYTSEGRRWLDRTLGVAGRSSAARLKALCGAGLLAHIQRESGAARGYLETAVAMASEAGDRWALAWALQLLGRVAYFDGDATAARGLAEQSLAAGLELSDDWLVAWALHLLGLAAHIAARYAEARDSTNAP
jgi:predicted ATPase/DNA-binding XRE family transcriptional regulator